MNEAQKEIRDREQKGECVCEFLIRNYTLKQSMKG
jgi:hypothetical protein